VYLSWKAKTFDFFNRFIELATDINGNMPRFVVNKLMHLLNDRAQCLKGSAILVVGVAYKPGVNDTRDSPGIEIFKLLEAAGAAVGYTDARVPQLDIDGVLHRSTALTPATLREQAAVVVVTAHPELDGDMLADHARLILDTRHAMRGHAGGHIVKL
jgi:UDP-N-acetyl-D-glucosamine dehydrogenase